MLRSSDAHLWVPCSLAGSLISSGNYTATTPAGEPEVDRTASRREGECASWVAERLINEPENDHNDFLDVKHNNGWIVDKEMIHHVRGYLEYVCGFGEPVIAEAPISLFGLITGRPDAATSSNGPVKHVFDLKYGHRLVEAHENWAMLCYGLATVSYGQTLALHIYQPRAQHPEGIARVWTIQPAEQQAWADWLYGRARECFQAPVGSPGPQCLRCPAAGSCAALAASGYAAYDTVRDSRTLNLSIEALGAELRFLELAEFMIKARKQAAETEMFARITRGQFIANWGIEPKLARGREFTVDAYTRYYLTGIDPYKQVEKSPAEMEREGAPADVLARITDRPQVGRKLTGTPEALVKRAFNRCPK